MYYVSSISEHFAEKEVLELQFNDAHVIMMNITCIKNKLKSIVRTHVLLQDDKHLHVHGVNDSDVILTLRRE